MCCHYKGVDRLPQSELDCSLFFLTNSVLCWRCSERCSARARPAVDAGRRFDAGAAGQPSGQPCGGPRPSSGPRRHAEWRSGR